MSSDSEQIARYIFGPVEEIHRSRARSAMESTQAPARTSGFRIGKPVHLSPIGARSSQRSGGRTPGAALGTSEVTHGPVAASRQYSRLSKRRPTTNGRGRES